ncbi:CoA pyrophosphatase [Xenorhabdus mauleonii]|uniref:8-oxo-dGTP pyrophosphatase MutT, NUDIX family n=1 Tax=Xenorhabdus mauleonii TaxID=351675 RepID=A0A1I3NA23_9GAMM|nr:CoA pyrophosphatase [Xenorhabdus mauleonii]PHM45741.1 CoA pyrophosphatase [Xenorhabdus mauleonii]SFJ05810.1 8-oxo-dGTP pyrophosphatase MutT, NUDIX family [Xenorhabdus mauleonii]
MTSLSDFIHRFQLQLPAQPAQLACNQRNAAVLLPIICKPEPTLLLTQRSRNLRSHAGQIAFPGGAADPEDPSLIVTALREAEEEVNIPQDEVQILGQLFPLDSSGGYRVTPVIGLIPPSLSLRTNPTEVAKMFEVPLFDVLSIAHYRYVDIKRRNRLHRVYFYWHQEQMIWGLTAGILYQLAQQVQKTL